jgi:hypothetical protein
MTMPGFTAEASLGKTTMKRYGLTLERAAGGGKVHPQGYVIHCYQGGHCNWRWVPEPNHQGIGPITKT